MILVSVSKIIYISPTFVVKLHDINTVLPYPRCLPIIMMGHSLTFTVAMAKYDTSIYLS